MIGSESGYKQLKSRLAGLDSLLVAFSGGVDSTLLLSVAAEVLGDRVMACTAISETTAHHEVEDAKKLARQFGVRHEMVKTDELGMPEFVRNPEDKCYICKKSRFSILKEMALREGYKYVADGENTDDLDDYRPGRKAARELGIVSPLREAGLNKAEIH